MSTHDTKLIKKKNNQLKSIVLYLRDHGRIARQIQIKSDYPILTRPVFICRWLYVLDSFHERDIG